jgi:hypothetical protein
LTVTENDPRIAGLQEQARREQAATAERLRSEKEEMESRARQDKLDLIAFLRARYDSEEQGCRDNLRVEEPGPWEQLLVEIDSKRRIVKEYADNFEAADSESCPNEWNGGIDKLRWFVMPLLAAPYADHPDFKEHWLPDWDGS